MDFAQAHTSSTWETKREIQPSQTRAPHNSLLKTTNKREIWGPLQTSVHPGGGVHFGRFVVARRRSSSVTPRWARSLATPSADPFRGGRSWLHRRPPASASAGGRRGDGDGDGQVGSKGAVLGPGEKLTYKLDKKKAQESRSGLRASPWQGTSNNLLILPAALLEPCVQFQMSHSAELQPEGGRRCRFNSVYYTRMTWSTWSCTIVLHELIRCFDWLILVKSPPSVLAGKGDNDPFLDKSARLVGSGGIANPNPQPAAGQHYNQATQLLPPGTRRRDGSANASIIVETK